MTFYVNNKDAQTTVARHSRSIYNMAEDEEKSLSEGSETVIRANKVIMFEWSRIITLLTSVLFRNLRSNSASRLSMSMGCLLRKYAKSSSNLRITKIFSSYTCNFRLANELSESMRAKIWELINGNMSELFSSRAVSLGVATNNILQMRQLFSGLECSR